MPVFGCRLTAQVSWLGLSVYIHQMNRVNTPYDYGHDDSDLKFSQDESSIASSTALLPFVYSVKCPKAKERWLTMTIVVPPTIKGREFPKVTETNSSCFFMLSLLSA